MLHPASMEERHRVPISWAAVVYLSLHPLGSLELHPYTHVMCSIAQQRWFSCLVFQSPFFFLQSLRSTSPLSYGCCCYCCAIVRFHFRLRSVECRKALASCRDWNQCCCVLIVTWLTVTIHVTWMVMWQDVVKLVTWLF